jgi:prepilin-type N-terminal cleavage/methylation domain-containing protein/prepilin-type processing-associated H-X9-DG protein
MSWKCSASERGFTIVELLVVVSIIALLISILLPSLSGAQEMARTVKCASNLKQYGAANDLYADSLDSYYVPILDGSQPFSDGWFWVTNSKFREGLGVEHRRDISVDMVCPNAPGDEIGQDAHAFSVPTGQAHLEHIYGMNRQGGYTNYRPNVQIPAKRAQLSDVNMWMHGKGNANPSAHWDVAFEDHKSAGGIAVAYRHNKGANVQHFDGHVERYHRDTWDEDFIRDRLWADPESDP